MDTDDERFSSKRKRKKRRKQPRNSNDPAAQNSSKQSNLPNHMSLIGYEDYRSNNRTVKQKRETAESRLKEWLPNIKSQMVTTDRKRVTTHSRVPKSIGHKSEAESHPKQPIEQSSNRARAPQIRCEQSTASKEQFWVESEIHSINHSEKEWCAKRISNPNAKHKPTVQRCGQIHPAVAKPKWDQNRPNKLVYKQTNIGLIPSIQRSSDWVCQSQKR